MANSVNSLLKNFKLTSNYGGSGDDILIGEGTLSNQGLKTNILSDSQKVLYESRKKQEAYEKKVKEEETKKMKNKLETEYEKAKAQLIDDMNSLSNLKPGSKYYSTYLEEYNKSVKNVENLDKVKSSDYSSMKKYINENNLNQEQSSSSQSVGTIGDTKEINQPQVIHPQNTKQQVTGSKKVASYPKGLGGGTKTPSQYFSEHGLDWNKDASRIAKDAGIENYSGTASQNLQLISFLENKGENKNQQSIHKEQINPDNGELNTQVFGDYKKDTTYSDDNMPEWMSKADADKIKSDRYSTPTREEGMITAIKNSALEKMKSLIEEDNKAGAADKKGWMQKLGITDIDQLTPDMATKYLEKNKEYFAKEQVAKDANVDTSQVRSLGRQDLLNEIAEGKKVIGKDVQTTLSKDEQSYINNYKSTKQKNAIKNAMNDWVVKLNTALKVSKEEGAKVKAEWKDWIKQQKEINPEFSKIENELKAETKNLDVGKGTPSLNVNTSIKDKKQTDGTTTATTSTPDYSQPDYSKAHGSTDVWDTTTGTWKINPNADKNIKYNYINNGETATVTDKIEGSINQPNEPQSTIAPKNILKQN